MQLSNKREKPMTQTAYAKARGVNKSTISKQIAAGILKLNKRGLVDPKEADAARANNLDQARERDRGAA
jgi:hypothetical protein